MRSFLLGDSGFLNIVFGSVSVVASLVFYSVYTSSFPLLDFRILRMFRWLSYGTMLLMLFGLIAVFLGIREMVRSRSAVGAEYSSFKLSDIVATVLSSRKYSWVVRVSAAAYAFFFAAVSSIIVYRPYQNFAEDYFAVIPSVVPTVCCDSPGFVPIFTVYLTEHLGLLIIPANILLMILVSGLVGVNSALAIYEYDNRPKIARGRWALGFGAVTGLFTACPTCAGLFLGNLIQGAGITAMAVVLASYQPLFIAATIPLLAASMIIMARRLKPIFSASCAVQKTQ